MGGVYYRLGFGRTKLLQSIDVTTKRIGVIRNEEDDIYVTRIHPTIIFSPLSLRG